MPRIYFGSQPRKWLVQCSKFSGRRAWKINTQNLIIFTYEIFKKMLSVNYEIKTTFYRMTRTPQMLYCVAVDYQLRVNRTRIDNFILNINVRVSQHQA